MLTINLGRGFHDIVEGHQSFGLPYPDVDLPAGLFDYDGQAHVARTRPIQDAFDMCQRAGWDEEKTIRKLIEVYFYPGFFRLSHFKTIPLVIGYIGPRGSGKTVGMVATATVDWLLREGMSVWSNVPIEVRVCYGGASHTFRSLELEQIEMLDLAGGYRGGVALVDEVNMEAGESSRYMSAANLQFAGFLQQIRKRKLSVLWTAQSFMTVDPRVRWQTDFMVMCRDAFLSGVYGVERPGTVSVWNVSDLSGMTGAFTQEFEETHRYITQYKVWDGGHVSMRAWWGAYNTDLQQGEGDYISEYRRERDQREAIELSADVLERQRPERELAERMKADGIWAVNCLDLWHANGCEDDKGQQTRIGKAMVAAGYVRRRGTDGKRFYELKE